MERKAQNARPDKYGTKALIRWHKAQQNRHQALANNLAEQHELSDGTIGPIRPLAGFLRRKREAKGWNVQK